MAAFQGQGRESLPVSDYNYFPLLFLLQQLLLLSYLFRLKFDCYCSVVVDEAAGNVVVTSMEVGSALRMKGGH